MKIVIACAMVFGLLAFKVQAFRMEKDSFLEEGPDTYHDDEDLQLLAFRMEKNNLMEEGSGSHEDRHIIEEKKKNFNVKDPVDLKSYIFLIIISALLTYSFLLIGCWQCRKWCCRE